MTFTGYSTALFDFIGHFRTRSQVINFCGSNHVYPLKAPKNIGNCIVYTMIDNDQPSYYQNSFGLSQLFIQVDFYSTNYTTLKTLTDALYQTYHGFSGRFTYNDISNNNASVTSIIYSKIEVNGITSRLQEIDDDVYRISLDFIITY